MNSISAISTQISALLSARDAIEAEDPIDNGAFNQVTNDIVALNRRLQPLINAHSTATDPPAGTAALGAAIDQLNSEINASEGANVLLASAAVIANL